VPDLLILLLIVLGIVVYIRGPKMLPKLGEAFGRGVKDVREQTRDRLEEKEGDSEDVTTHQA